MMNRTMAGVFGSTACVLASVVPALGQLTYTGATRDLTARVAAGGAGPSDARSSNALMSVDFAADALLEGPPFAGEARSHSVTTLSPLQCLIQGDFVLNRPAAAGTGTAYASQTIHITFTTSAADFLLAGNMPASSGDPGPFPPARSVSLTGPGVNLVLNEPNVFSIPGHFAGGVYELSVDVETWNYGTVVPFEGIASFNVGLTTVPAPGVLAVAGLGALGMRRRRRS